jgi:hypothetical protein
MRFLWFVLVVGWGLFFISSIAEASHKRWPEWSDEVVLDFGRCLWAEDSSGDDWPALGWSLVKQWRLVRDRRTFHQQIRWYCAVFAKLGPRWFGTRPQRIRDSNWDSPLDGTVEQWLELRSFIARFSSRLVSDPCPNCVWWGGQCDFIPPTWTCPLSPPKSNNFFCHLIEKPGR